MTVTRHISLDEDHIEKMRPYVEKHNGNFGNALREIITMAFKNSPHMNSSYIDSSILNWTLSELDGLLVPDDVLDRTIDPMLITSMGCLESYLKERFSELKWDIEISMKYDRDMFPSDVFMEIKGITNKTKFVASLVSQYLVKNSLLQAPLKIKAVFNFNECIKVEFERSNSQEAENSHAVFFLRLGPDDKDHKVPA